jgi:HD domain
VTVTIAGVTIPDTTLVQEATELVTDVEDNLLFNHSRRVYLWGTLQGGRRGLEPDPELLYVGAMFHDLGLTTKYAASINVSSSTGPTSRKHSYAATGSRSRRRVWLGSHCTRRRGSLTGWSRRSPW